MISTEPYNYLIKTYQRKKLFSSIDMEIMKFNKQFQTDEEAKKDFVFIKSNHHYEKIMLDSILFIESRKNYLLLTTTQKEYQFRSTLKDFASKLPDIFIRTNKSFIVNSSKIDCFNIGFISIYNKEVPISKTYKKEVINKLNSFLLSL